MKKIKLTKIKELKNALHPNNIPVNNEYIGYMVDEPKIGFRFNVSGDNPISTSGVQEILENNTFKTWSSIYKIEYLND